MDKTAVEHCVAGYFAAIRAMDGEAWLASFATDALDHDPANAPPNIGHAALRLYFQARMDAACASKASMFEFNPAGKIQQLWGYWDPAAMLAELNGLA